MKERTKRAPETVESSSLLKKELEEFESLRRLRVSMEKSLESEKRKEKLYSESGTGQKAVPLEKKEQTRVGNRYMRNFKGSQSKGNLGMSPGEVSIDEVKRQSGLFGIQIHSVFGEKLLVNADFYRNGSMVEFIETEIGSIAKELQGDIWNQQSPLGLRTKKAMDKVIQKIKEHFGADPQDVISISFSSGNQSILEFQKLIGVCLNPATRQTILECYGLNEEKEPKWLEKDFFLDFLRKKAKPKLVLPLVVLGPDEPFYNDISWKECLCEIQYMKKTKEGDIDLAYLQELLASKASEGQKIISSFSAASPVTGQVYSYLKTTEILKKHKATVCLDISMILEAHKTTNLMSSSSPPDAIVVSLDQLTGGLHSPSVLLCKKTIHSKELPPLKLDFHNIAYGDSEQTLYHISGQLREIDGRPPLNALLRGYYALLLRNSISQEKRDERTRLQIEKIYGQIGKWPNIKILTDPKTTNKLPMLSFVVFYKDKQLHPGYISRLLFDAFGVQVSVEHSNASQFDALLKFNRAQIEMIKDLVKEEYYSIVPGWNKIVLGPLIDEEELDYIINAVKVVAEFGIGFLPDYALDLYSGKWKNMKEKPNGPFDLGTLPEVSSLLSLKQSQKCSRIDYGEYSMRKKELFEESMRKAKGIGEKLMEKFKRKKLEEKIEALKVGVDKYDKVKYFYIANIIEC